MRRKRNRNRVLVALATSGIGHGDRVLYLGIGQRRGQHGDAMSPRSECAGIRFDDGLAGWCLTKNLHPIPRRAPPMF